MKQTKKNKSYVFGQNLTSVGWVAGTLPELYERDGVIELPMADVAGGGIVTGAALVGRRPIYIIRYQGYNWFNCIFIINYHILLLLYTILTTTPTTTITRTET